MLTYLTCCSYSTISDIVGVMVSYSGLQRIDKGENHYRNVNFELDNLLYSIAHRNTFNIFLLLLQVLRNDILLGYSAFCIFHLQIFVDTYLFTSLFLVITTVFQPQ